VIRRAHHLPEERLLDCYLNERDGIAVDPRLAEHLTDCGECGSRYADLARFMDGLRAEAEIETDAVFTAERLRTQQQHIARRLEHAHRLGKVIAFPCPIARRAFTVSTVRTAPRWVAAAAAAGLFVGLALGASYRWEIPGRRGMLREIVTARSGPLSPGKSRINASRDDEFMSELDVALDRPRTRELMAIDELTPHFREIRTSR